MAGGKFQWVRPEVLPCVAAVALGCAFCGYSIVRNVYTCPEVYVTKTARLEGVPESGIREARAEGYKWSVYRALKGSSFTIF